MIQLFNYVFFLKHVNGFAVFFVNNLFFGGVRRYQVPLRYLIPCATLEIKNPLNLFFDKFICIMSDFIKDVIEKRRAIYPNLYNDEPISREELMETLATANFAPTHKLTQPWRFVVIEGAKKSQLAEILGQWYHANTPPEAFKASKPAKMLKKASQSAYMVAIVMQRDALRRIPEWEEIASVAMAVQNVWLAGATKGIGMYWSSPKSIASDEVRAFLQLNDEQRCLGFLYMGRYPQELELHSTRTPMEEKVKFL